MSVDAENERLLWETWGKKFENLAVSHPLRVLFWQTTLRCDSSCLYCSSPQEWWNKEEELTTNEICRTLKSIANDFDLNNIAQLSFTGGEPLLRQDLPEVARYARNLGFQTLAVQTNGYIASQQPDLVEELIESGVSIWGVNIDGPRHVHNSLRNGGEWFTHALSFAKSICQDARLNVTVSTLVCHENICFIPQVYDLVRVLKPDLWRIALFDPVGRGANTGSDYLLSSSDLNYLLEFVAGIRAQHQADADAFELEIGCGGWLGQEWEGVVRPYIFHCVSGLDTMTILYDGGITGCPVVSKELIQGNVRKNNVKEVWESGFGYYRDAKQRAPENCLACKDWHFCHGGCLHNYKRHEAAWDFPMCLRNIIKGADG